MEYISLAAIGIATFGALTFGTGDGDSDGSGLFAASDRGTRTHREGPADPGDWSAAGNRAALDEEEPEGEELLGDGVSVTGSLPDSFFEDGPIVTPGDGAEDGASDGAADEPGTEDGDGRSDDGSEETAPAEADSESAPEGAGGEREAEGDRGGRDGRGEASEPPSIDDGPEELERPRPGGSSESGASASDGPTVSTPGSDTGSERAEPGTPEPAAAIDAGGDGASDADARDDAEERDPSDGPDFDRLLDQLKEDMAGVVTYRTGHDVGETAKKAKDGIFGTIGGWFGSAKDWATDHVVEPVSGAWDWWSDTAVGGTVNRFGGWLADKAGSLVSSAREPIANALEPLREADAAATAWLKGRARDAFDWATDNEVGRALRTYGGHLLRGVGDGWNGDEPESPRSPALDELEGLSREDMQGLSSEHFSSLLGPGTVPPFVVEYLRNTDGAELADQIRSLAEDERVLFFPHYRGSWFVGGAMRAGASWLHGHVSDGLAWADRYTNGHATPVAHGIGGAVNDFVRWSTTPGLRWLEDNSRVGHGVIRGIRQGWNGETPDELPLSPFEMMEIFNGDGGAGAGTDDDGDGASGEAGLEDSGGVGDSGELGESGSLDDSGDTGSGRSGDTPSGEPGSATADDAPVAEVEEAIEYLDELGIEVSDEDKERFLAGEPVTIAGVTARRDMDDPNYVYVTLPGGSERRFSIDELRAMT